MFILRSKRYRLSNAYQLTGNGALFVLGGIVRRGAGLLAGLDGDVLRVSADVPRLPIVAC